MAEVKNQDGSVTYGTFGNGTQVRLRDYQGKQYVDIRKFLGDVPTKKGITLHVDNLGDCISLLEKIEAIVKKA